MRKLFLLFLLLVPALSACAVNTHLGRSDLQRIAGKTYVVTGASSGFGRGVAEMLGRERANVVLAARRANVLEEVAAVIRASGGQALVIPTDVSDPAQVERLARETVARFGRIDVWINDAAVGTIGRFEEIPIADHARAVDVNLKGVIYGSHHAVRQFKAQGHGVLINLGSVESQVPLAYHASYAATKAGIWALGRAMNEELRKAGYKKRIQVVTIMPWAADTPFWDHAANYSGHKGRMAALDPPEKVVQAIVWASLHPREEVPVGWKAQAVSAFHTITPDLVEAVSGNIAHAEQMRKAAPQAPGPGAMHQPMAEGTSVDGGVRARMKAEDRAREGGETPR
ncbi:SDR family NAD(P)-dependent oxidoreductase [Sphingomonas xinjiangensis]|uniref:Short-subunit dehydrogenase n=1 Tax=Sphingomonas xinjiangensis TaxID=643568 RepID=A0A840YD03_9SPHN|nr:SDR family NAD(P)-dependent oxidoreductase [Sphingomonas xinjiangensis]MBB5709889.1 short-subunit dehydrogenase [Sphingomonas xinjiangensis]